MSSATITLTDGPGDEIIIKISFGEGGLSDTSGAHYLAATLLRTAAESHDGTNAPEFIATSEVLE